MSARLTRAMLTALYLALDPHRQGDAWPDPVAFDGRTLRDQAHDALDLAEATIHDAIDSTDADRLRAAMEPVEAALAVRP